MIASDSITITTGETTITITKSGIEMKGNISMQGNLHSSTFHASNIEPWDNENGGGDGGSSNGDGTVVITQFDDEISIDPLIEDNPTTPVTFTAPANTAVTIRSSISSQTITTNSQGFGFATVNLPYVAYPDGEYVNFTFSINGVEKANKVVHIAMTSDPSLPDPNAHKDFTATGLPTSVSVGRSNGYEGVMTVVFTAPPGSKIYTSIDWENGGWTSPYATITDKRGNATGYFTVSMPPGKENFTFNFSCDGFDSISRSVQVIMTD